MKNGEHPGWLPYSMRIYAYQVKSDLEKESSCLLEPLLNRYTGITDEDDGSYNITIDSVQLYVKEFTEKEGHILLLAAGPGDEQERAHDSVPSEKVYDDKLEEASGFLPKASEAFYSISLAYTSDEEKALKLLQEQQKGSGLEFRSAGIIGNQIMASHKGFESSERRLICEILVIHFGSRGKAAEDVWGFSLDLCQLALYTGEMSRLFMDRSLMFDQIDASESSTQIWVNEILAKMRRPVDEIQPEDLEEILKEITIQFSRLSTLEGSMRRDKVKAENLHRKLMNLLGAWDERSIEGRLANTIVLISEFENMMAPFRDFIERTGALMAQITTILDSVRTYLGIKQQKISISESVSSKEQLIRLVNLQETLHKLEVLIVAVYILEMARIIFEAFAHEHVNLLSAIFVPIALLISIIIGRLLHKEH